MKFIFPMSLVIALFLICTIAPTAQADDPLPSWNSGASKEAILRFVKSVSTEGASRFVPSSERIAVFDNDGTLWAEQPLYFQLAFAIDRVKALASNHPEWRDKQPFKTKFELIYAPYPTISL